MGARTIAGRYELEEALGSSSWRATDTELGRPVLVRLGDEGTPSAVLSHPSIARVFDQGEDDGERYAVLEFLAGGTLEKRLPELSESEAQAVAADVAAAVEYAHAQGVVHGSLSLASILLDGEGRAKVAGFGGRGTPEEDLLALDSILASLAQVAPTREEQTAVIAPPAAQAAGRRSLVLAAVAALALLIAGVGTAFLATRDSSGDLRTGSLSVPVPSETAPGVTEAPPPQPTTSETTTTATTTTEPQPTTTPTPAPPPTTTVLPPPPTVELPPTTEELPPTTTEELPLPPTETDG